MRPTFYRRGDQCISRCEAYPRRVSPVYVTARAAKDLLEQGVSVRLPDGYDVEILEQVTWMVGTYDEDVTMSTDQAREMAELGRELLDNFSDKLDTVQITAIRELISVVTD